MNLKQATKYVATWIINVITGAWGYILGTYLWGEDLIAKNYKTVACIILIISRIILILLTALVIFTIAGLIIGWFWWPWVGWWLLMVALLLTTVLSIGFRIIVFALNTAIFLVRLAIAVIANPALWAVDEVWQIIEWPFKFSKETLKKFFAGILAALKADKETIDKILEVKQLAPLEPGPLEELKKLLKELMLSSKKTTLAVVTIFKMSSLGLILASLLILLLGGQHNPNSLFGFLGDGKVAVAFFVLFVFLVVYHGQKEYNKLVRGL